MTFGQIKSIIEKNLVESFKDTSSFKQTLKEFKHNVLTNKSFSKIYSIYDDLSSPQGLSESDAKEFLDEAVIVIRHLLEKTSLPKNGEKSENLYENIDNVIYFNKVDIKERLNSKKTILSKLVESKIQVKDIPKIPIKSMVLIANQTLSRYVAGLDESSRKEIFHILAKSDSDLETEFTNLKESAVNKLKVLTSKEKDVDLKTKIFETIGKIELEKYDLINYVRLKKLEESILLDS
jgi:hypothetical protein